MGGSVYLVLPNDRKVSMSSFRKYLSLIDRSTGRSKGVPMLIINDKVRTPFIYT
jgi:hypothetical protein